MSAQFEEPRKDNLKLIAGYDRTFIGTASKWDTTTESYETANITGGIITMKVTASDGSTKWTKTGTITDGANGIFEIEFTDTDSTAADKGTYDYIVEYTDSSSNKYLLVKGKFEVV